MLSRLAGAACARQRVSRSIFHQWKRQLSDPAAHFQFSRAIVGNIPNSFVHGSLRFKEPQEPINLELARKQIADYIAKLKQLTPTVIQIPVDERFPDLVFVEDPAVVLGNTALLTHMRPRSRIGETAPMRPVLEEMGFDIVEMKDPDAYLDGGDVMFTGREFLVGLSGRTNSAGVASLSKAFPDWPVTCITVQPEVLHLKSMSSMAGIDLIAIGGSPAGQATWREIETKAHYKYKKLVFPDNNGANCLFINGTVLHPAREEYPDSFEVWQTLVCPRVEVPNSEMAKADGSLTCNSLRLQ